MSSRAGYSLRPSIFSTLIAAAIAGASFGARAQDAAAAPAAAPAEAAPAAAPATTAEQPAPGSGQQAAATELEKVEVTGTRIRQIDIEGPLPITVISSADIAKSGDLSVAQYLQSTNFNSFGSGVPISLNGQGAQGAAQIDLRGLGSERTLVLLDGRRLPLDPGLGAQAANLNIIPMAIVERIEILREGASAVYGSDAIGGVINVITKKNINVFTLSGQLDRPTQKGGDGANATLTGGFGANGANMYFSLDHSQTAAIAYKDRPYARNASSAYGSPGTIDFAFTGAPAADGSNEDTAAEGPFSNCPSAFDADAAHPDSASIGGVCRYRFGSVALISADTKRDTLTVGANYFLPYDIQTFGRFVYTRGQNVARSAPAPITSAPNPYGLPEIKPDNPNNPHPGDTLYLLFRPLDGGPRIDDVNEIVTDFVGGLKGAFNFLGASSWEFAATQNRYSQTDIGNGFGLIREFQQAIDSGEYNPFDPQPGTNRSFLYTVSNNNDYSWHGVDGHVSFDNVLEPLHIEFRLPIVFGAEMRAEHFKQIADAQSATSFTFDQNGQIDGANISNVFGSAGGNTEGGRHEYAVYTESQLDFFDGRLNVGGAARYDNYSLGGGKVSPKLSIAARPISMLLARASFSKGFRAPDLTQLFQAPSQGFTAARDTVGCNSNPQAPDADDPCSTSAQRQLFVVGNQKLKPERSTNWTAGIVVNPLNDLSVSADYYRITLDDGITTLDLQQIFDNEATCGANCDPATQGKIVRFSNGAVNFAYDPTVNATSITTNGVDLDANYKLPTSAFGNFTFDLGYSQVFSYKQKSDANAPDVEKIDSISFPRYRLMGQVSWRAHNFAAAINAHFVPGQKDCDAYTIAGSPGDCPDHRVSSYTQFDIQGSYHLPWRNEITVGMRNMFNKNPPSNQFYAGSSDPQGIITPPQQNGQQLYSFEGRVPYIRFTQSF